jgi:hypothetical protein
LGGKEKEGYIGLRMQIREGRKEQGREGKGGVTVKGNEEGRKGGGTGNPRGPPWEFLQRVCAT